MITKNRTYGNVENVTIVEFGYGTTRIVNANGEGYKSLLFRSNSEPKEIGEIGEKFPTSDEFNPQLVIAFWNEESFSVFEEFVKNIREEFNKEKIKSTEESGGKNNIVDNGAAALRSSFFELARRKDLAKSHDVRSSRSDKRIVRCRRRPDVAKGA